jgi:hypothetical protein
VKGNEIENKENNKMKTRILQKIVYVTLIVITLAVAISASSAGQMG